MSDPLPELRAAVTAVDIDPLTAAEALKAASFTDPDGERRIHTFMGVFGADWDLAGALDAVETAEKVCWAPHLLGHELAIVEPGDKGRVVRFDVKAPAGTFDPPPERADRPVVHNYFSTACLHNEHGRCRVYCKFCEAICNCRQCNHQEQP